MAGPRESGAAAVRLFALILILLVIGWYLVANHSSGSKAPQTPVTPSTSATPTEVPATAWQRLPVDLVASLRAQEDASRDWNSCEILYGDTTIIRCPDGYRLES